MKTVRSCLALAVRAVGLALLCITAVFMFGGVGLKEFADYLDS